jgi:ADP-ribosylglycohydrolase
MLGAIIGDIIGSRWEFNPTNDYHFELFSDKNGFTDDTICTIAVADAILHDSADYGKYIHEWCNRFPHPMGGYGGRFAQWVRSDNPQPYGSFGNGSAMRVSPVAWAFHRKNFVLEAAKHIAECTHNHPEGIKGAQTVALAIYRALQLRRLNLNAPDVVKTVIAECVDFSGYNIDLQKEIVQNKFDETCQGTVPVALWIIGQSRGFEDAVRRAVSLGADADTLGAIVGSIAEAIWGIPENLRVTALSYLDSRMKKVLSKWKSCEQIKTIGIKTFIDKYIDYFLTKFAPDSQSYYDFFDSSSFPDECWSLGFEMDCGGSFIAAYGEEAWNSHRELLSVIDKADDIIILGSALFSQWRYFNHWAFGHATEENKEWFLIILRRMQELTK